MKDGKQGAEPYIYRTLFFRGATLLQPTVPLGRIVKTCSQQTRERIYKESTRIVELVAVYGLHHPCGDGCKYAYTSRCDCECQGKNHGLGNDAEYKGEFWTPLQAIEEPMPSPTPTIRRIQEMPLPLRDCPFCGLPFPPRKRDQRFCSPRCRSHSYYIQNAERCRQWTRDSRARDKARGTHEE